MRGREEKDERTALWDSDIKVCHTACSDKALLTLFENEFETLHKSLRVSPPRCATDAA